MSLHRQASIQRYEFFENNYCFLIKKTLTVEIVPTISA